MTYPIADMLTRIRNAYAASSKLVEIPYSGIKLALARKIESLGYLSEVTAATHPTIKNARIITAGLVYKNKLPILTHIKRVSKPGRRVYVTVNHQEVVLAGLGSTILTTSHGVLTDREAKLAGVGGEIICRIW